MRKLLLKRRIHEILEPIHAKDKLSRVVNLFLIILILLNVLAVILESVQGYSLLYSGLFKIFEICSVTIFTVEYLLRVWTCDSDEEFAAPVIGRLRFIVKPMSIIDLLAILPFFLPLLFVFDFRFIRILRVIRILRLLKLGRYFEVIQKLGRVFVAKREELIFTLGIVVLLLVISSTLMYYVENPVQPEVFSSIPAAMWWGVATLTTVGYGDVYPVTPVGKMLGAVIAIIGIGMVALPTGIIGSGFMEEIRYNSNEKIICPHCGREFEEQD
jgi:voltage-gated potassium channel